MERCEVGPNKEKPSPSHSVPVMECWERAQNNNNNNSNNDIISIALFHVKHAQLH